MIRAAAWSTLARAARGRVLRLCAGIVAGYLLLDWAFAFASESRGLLSPDGSPHAEVVVLGLAYIGARIALRFAVPALLAYAVASALLMWAHRVSTASYRNSLK